jgi:hypothetical protein
MFFYPSSKHLLLAAALLVAPVAQVHAQTATAACGASSQTCVASCGRFGQGDARLLQCETFCRHQCEPQPALPEPESAAAKPETVVRTHSKKADVVKERQLNARMIEAISRGSVRGIRQLIEVDGLHPTYVYAYDFNPQTRQYDGRPVGLRLTDIFNDPNELRSDDKGLDQVIALFIELGLDVTATLEQTPQATGAASSATAQRQRTAWGPSLKVMERARDRSARLRAFEIALQHGLKPNDDVDAWLFEELPQVCGRDRSQFAIQVVDVLSKHLGTSLQDDFWRVGERGPETVADVLDRLMSPGTIPRSNYERTQFALMDEVWENCSSLSRRVNRYLMQGN